MGENFLVKELLFELQQIINSKYSKCANNAVAKSVEIFCDTDVTNYSTMKLKACGDVIIVHSVEVLQDAVVFFKKKSIEYFVIGNGSNTVLPKRVPAVILKVDIPFLVKDFLSKDNKREIYDLPASIPLSVMTRAAQIHGLVGWEVFTGVPGTLGGAIFMNAGTKYGEIAQLLESVTTIKKDGTIQERKVTKNDFAYRKNLFLEKNEIIISAKIRSHGYSDDVSEKIKNYLIEREKSQPLHSNNCGCLFKNFIFNGRKSCLAGKHVDIIGLKGFEMNSLRLSLIHGNFLENFGDADFDDVKKYVRSVSDELYLQYGVRFETEIIF